VRWVQARIISRRLNSSGEAANLEITGAMSLVSPRSVDGCRASKRTRYDDLGQLDGATG
jgi:hypothetical protein